MVKLIVVPPGRFAGKGRAVVGAQLRERYESDPRVTVRSLSAEVGRSFGFVQRMLTQAGRRICARVVATAGAA